MIAGDGALASELALRMRRERDGDRARMHQDPTLRTQRRVEELEKSELAHHCHLIPLLPAFDDPAIFDAVENQPIDVHPPTGRWYLTERRCIRSVRGPARGDFIAAEDLVLDREVEIREGRQESGDHLLEPFH